MSEIDVTKTNPKTQVSVEITRSDDGASFQIAIRAPLLADLVDKMAIGVYPRSEFNEVYAPILEAAPNDKTKVISRPALYTATQFLRKGVDFSFHEKPCGCLLASAKALREGFVLTYKPSSPVPTEDIKKWGKNFMEACSEIITNTRPFKMQWYMHEAK